MRITTILLQSKKLTEFHIPWPTDKNKVLFGDDIRSLIVSSNAVIRSSPSAINSPGQTIDHQTDRQHLDRINPTRGVKVHICLSSCHCWESAIHNSDHDSEK